ncbi:MAG: 1,6-anhydro-N-acetylmuramyl-L-alanine amidase AmpD [Mariprofundus sp.]|nr:1,6-anhydro-N-acetylmuramyl-L-alanine amidase AmpD [Mariprofundus sp.]
MRLEAHAVSNHHQAMRELNSPHHNARPLNVEINLIILHAISLPAGQFESQYIDDLFMGRLDCAAHPTFDSLEGLKVSAHFVVARDGSITQFVACGRRAWHAGLSEWKGRCDCNDYAIGIEMIGDEACPFTVAQYRETARLCKALMQRYPAIAADRIVGHQDIAPGRKWDPGRQWNWQHFRRSLAHIQQLKLDLLPFTVAAK